MQNVAAKKTYVVPVVAEKMPVTGKTLGEPQGVGEPVLGLFIVGAV